VIIEAGQDTETDFIVPPGLHVQGRVTDADSGVPIAGARVGQAFRRWERVQNEVETDVFGRYVLDRFPDGCRIRVRAEGFAKFEAEVLSAVKAGREVVQDVRLHLAGRIAGRVVGPEGQGVPRAWITVVGKCLDKPLCGTTDEAGAFCLCGLAVNAERRLVVQGEGFADRITEAFTLRPGECRIGFLVRMSREGARVSGRIRDTGGEPIPKARLDLRRDDWLSTQLDEWFGVRHTTGSCFTMRRLPAGRYTLEVEASGFIGKRVNLILAEDSVREDVDFILERGRTLTGRVVDDQGRPVNGVSINVYSTHRGKDVAGRPVSTDTDARGRFTVKRMLPGICRLYPRKPGFEELGEPMRVRAGDRDVVLVLRRTSRGIHGRVRRADTDAPVNGFFVRWFHGHEARILRFNDGQGRFRIEGMNAGAYHLESGTNDGWISRDPVRIDLVPGGDSRRVDLAVGPGASLEGRVLEPGGSPLAGADVTVHRRSGPSGIVGAAITGRLGRFSIHSLVPDEHWVRARHPDWIEARALVTVGRHRTPEVALRLHKEGGVLEIRVRDSAGTPLAGVGVKIRRPCGAVMDLDEDKAYQRFQALQNANPDLSYLYYHSTCYWTDSNGILERHFLPPGRFLVEAHLFGYRPGRVEVEILAGVRWGVEVILMPGQSR